MDKKSVSALIKMLDEPDDRTYGLIRDSICQAGNQALPLLEEAMENTFDGLVQDRIQWLISKLQQENLYIDFVNWAAYNSQDLLKGHLLVTRTQYPSLDEVEITAKLEQLRTDIWIELRDDLTALENVKVMNHVLFAHHGFDGNKTDIKDPRNSYINTFLESRKGSPLSLGMLFIILGRKLDLPIYGVNLPQHFILAYLAGEGIAEPRAEDVLFYINPYNKGAVFTRREIDLFIRQMKIKPDPSFFTPCSNVEIIQRLISNLIFSYEQLGYSDKREQLEHLLTAIQ
jgi:regulator of sirC expression with transglutaminase-like and TPR domain